MSYDTWKTAEPALEELGAACPDTCGEVDLCAACADELEAYVALVDLATPEREEEPDVAF
jgi:hypothetical protein